MKIAHVFNLANDAFNIAQGLRGLGVDAELIIQRPTHVASLPQWEAGCIDIPLLGDVNNPNWEAFQYALPDWIHVWDARKRWHPFSRAIRWLNLFPLLQKYDLIVGHAPFAKFAPLYRKLTKTPIIIYDAGWIRYLPQNRRGYAKARQGYREAEKIIFTNVDTEDKFIAQGYEKSQLVYSPFAIDTERYSPNTTKLDASQDMVFFHPTRHVWSEKGNNLVIEAFAKYVHTNPKAHLVLVKWGQEGEIQSQALINSLGISRNVFWVPVMSKSQLIHWYKSATAVFDQFIFGALGTTTLEAMSCACPVVTYVKPELWLRYHKTAPPVLSTNSVDGIFSYMKALEDGRFREHVGVEERKWVIEECSLPIVAKHQLALYEKIMAGE